jgi:PilZ domain
METDLRRSTRVPFIAVAEIVELNTEVRLAAQTGDLSQHGCYMDMVNPLPLGSAVTVRIEHGKQTFAATAGVVYSVPHLGMGLVFRDIEAGKEITLERWLTDSAAASASA